MFVVMAEASITLPERMNTPRLLAQVISDR